MSNVPRSKQFDDVYFSQQDGLAEARHVFLDGNNLPKAWCNHDIFTICETGFGTGLNFLAVMKLWRDTPLEYRARKLHYVSFEKYPLTNSEIEGYLSRWEELSGDIKALLLQYPKELFAGRYDLEILEDIYLTLIFGDVNEEILKFDGKVDCWFLDGFKPSTNPDMWSDIVFSNMARLSRVNTSFATFTVAGFVRRALSEHGFIVRKVTGFGRKREMCVGSYLK